MNQTIYFRKKVWDVLKDEPDKSKVVNELLEKYYLTLQHNIDKPINTIHDNTTHRGTIHRNTIQPKIIKTVDDIPKKYTEPVIVTKPISTA